MKIIDFENIGSVKFVASRQVKNINITIKPGKGVRVSYPKYTGIQQAIQFVNQKHEWIRNHLLKINEIEHERSFVDENTVFKTIHHTLTVKKYQGNTAKASVKNGLIEVLYPENVDIRNSSIQALIQRAIQFALKNEAGNYLPKRTAELAGKFNFTYSEVKITKATTRWGSCSGRDNINYSVFLMKLPSHLIDYVILHELCHTVHKNHGNGFWKLLDKVTGNAKGLDNELKNYSCN